MCETNSHITSFDRRNPALLVALVALAVLVAPGCKKTSTPANGDAGTRSDGSAAKGDAARTDAKPAVVCQPDAGDHRKGLSESCACNGDCQTGFCADGVCCNSDCTEGCKACNLLSSLGTCSFVPAGVQPIHDPACVAARPLTCGLDGTCDGQGGCRKYVRGVECSSGKCDGDSVDGRSECDGTGKCSPVSATNCAPFSCDPSSNQCATKCNSDALCASGQKCKNQSCGLKLNGQLCSTGDAECASGHCANGVCCNMGCTSACMRCDQPGFKGSCTYVDTGLPDPVGCKGGDKSTCALTGLCDGFGSCTQFPENTPCGSAICSTETSVSTARTCDGKGTCREAGLTDCAPFLCSSGACNKDCSQHGDADCEPGHACAAKQIHGSTVMLCGGKKNGQSCSDKAECDSSQCVDGVCCESDCSGACRSCAIPGKEGRCTNVAAGGTDPRAVCSDKGKASCSTDGLCDGNGSCQGYPTGTICGPETCKNSAYTPPSTCNSTGQCVASNSRGCDPYICNGSACYPSCKNDSQCNTQQGRTCQNASCGKKPIGAVCSAGDDCQSNACAQGVCCNSACTDACMSCNLTASAGLCTAVADGTPDPQGVCASTSQDTCGTTGLCRSGACAAWDNGRNCGGAACSSDGLSSTAALACDGRGKCVTPNTNNCFPFKCDRATGLCGNTCATDSDCQSPQTCANKSCGLKTNGAACTAGIQCSSGSCTEGVCCDSACSDATTGSKGLCKSCTVAGKVGTCSSVAAGTDDPKKRCSSSKSDPTAGVPNCSNSGTCDGGGKCAPWSSSTGCRKAGCSGNDFVASVTCDGKGNCPAAPSPASCSPYVCSALSPSCPISCVDDGQCDTGAGYACSGQKCKKKNGQTCLAGTDCGSGNCVSTGSGKPSVCCSAACGEDATCGVKALCDASGTSCQSHKDEACGTTACATDHLSSTAAGKCDGVGACVQKTTECSPYLCSDSKGICLVSPCAADTDCDVAGGFRCISVNGVKKCAKEGQGAACATTTDCSTGLTCVEKVCCSSASCPVCQSCAVPGQEGSCKANPVANGTACGVVTSCKDVGTQTGGDTCTDGACVPAGDQPCAPYVCSTNACAKTCGGAVGCAAGYTCSTGGKCLLPNGSATSCGGDGACASGHCVGNICCAKACSAATGVCGNTGACLTNGSECAKVPVGTACGPDGCSGNKLLGSYQCDSSDQCTPSSTLDCNAYLCVSTPLRCPTSCSDNGACAGSNVCSLAGVCVPPQDKGVGCLYDVDCASGNCVSNGTALICCAGSCLTSNCGNPGLCDAASFTCVQQSCVDGGN